MLKASYVSFKTRSSFLEDCLLVGIGSICIALAAPIAIRLPFTVVPIALAPHLCLALGLFLGSKRASFTVLAYLLQGIMGLPVFALGASGPLYFAGPTGGYLLGYLAGAYVTGYLVETMQNRSTHKIFGALALGNLTIYLFGAIHLSLFIGIKSAILLGVLPFLFGDALKNLALSKMSSRY